MVLIGILILSWTNFFAQMVMPHFVNTTQVESDVFSLINEERTRLGLPMLQEDEALDTIANYWSDHMAETGNLTHGDFESRIAQIGYTGSECGEIIAMYGGWTPDMARKFVDMWLNSYQHSKIMMTPPSGYMGIGVSKGSEGFFAVADFRFVD